MTEIGNQSAFHGPMCLKKAETKVVAKTGIK